MLKIITFLLTVIEYQTKLIKMLVVLATNRPAKKNEDEPVNKPYRKLSADEMPIFEKALKGEYKHIIADHLSKTGVTIKPVKHRKTSKVPQDLRCPYCDAPHEYLYDNNGGKGQYLCKVCTAVFNKNDKPLRDVILKCPHCRSLLQKVKKRKDFDIFKCTNDNCAFYIRNIKKMSSAEKSDFTSHPHKYKVRYIYRKFNIDFAPLSKKSKVITKVSLQKESSIPYIFNAPNTFSV